jgi:hypothetical protein
MALWSRSQITSLSEGALIMFFSQLLPRRAPRKKPASRRVELEVLERRALLSTSGAHFTLVDASIIQSGVQKGAYTVTFSEAGIGNAGGTETVTLAIPSASATWACVNGGGNHPKAANKETVTAPLSASGDFGVDRNGHVTGTLTAGPPGPGDFTCPGGQTLKLIHVEYSAGTLTDDTNGATATTPELSADFPLT